MIEWRYADRFEWVEADEYRIFDNGVVAIIYKNVKGESTELLTHISNIVIINKN